MTSEEGQFSSSDKPGGVATAPPEPLPLSSANVTMKSPFDVTRFENGRASDVAVLINPKPRASCSIGVIAAACGRSGSYLRLEHEH